MAYTVGEMAKKLGLSASTLRYYDKEGLLPFVERSDGGARLFSERDFGWLKVIECLKRSGLSIKEIKSFTEMAQRGDASLAERLALFTARRAVVREMIEELRETLAVLDFKCWYYGQAVSDGTEEHVRSMALAEVPEKYRAVREKMGSLHEDA
jgi:DNA-binding transcriptional MerR regulator